MVYAFYLPITLLFILLYDYYLWIYFCISIILNISFHFKLFICPQGAIYKVTQSNRTYIEASYMS